MNAKPAAMNVGLAARAAENSAARALTAVVNNVAVARIAAPSAAGPAAKFFAGAASAAAIEFGEAAGTDRPRAILGTRSPALSEQALRTDFRFRMYWFADRCESGFDRKCSQARAIRLRIAIRERGSPIEKIE